MKRRLFIDNFEPGTKREALEALFQPHGKVESVIFPEHSMRDVPTHAFIVMSNDTEATQAIRTLNNTDWKGFRLTVTHAGPSDSGSGFSGTATAGELKNR